MAEQPNAYWEDIQNRQYDGFGRCIYCGSDGEGLPFGDEHILPFSMGGNTWIRDAVCKKCEGITNPADTHLAKVVFEEYRIHANVQTRSPEDRATELPARIEVDGVQRSVTLPIADHPYVLEMPIWPDAGFARSALIDEPWPVLSWMNYEYIPPSLHTALGLAPDRVVKIIPRERPRFDLFARAIVKIAYCHTVARRGLGSFRALAIPEIILGRCSAIPYFIGSRLVVPPPPFRSGIRHAVNFHELTALSIHPETAGMATKLLVVSVRLFADSAHKDHGLPIYHVIVGAPGPQRASPVRPPLILPKVIHL